MTVQRPLHTKEHLEERYYPLSGDEEPFVDRGDGRTGWRFKDIVRLSIRNKTMRGETHISELYPWLFA